MATIETVTMVEEDRLHWVAVIEDETFEWDADVVEHIPDEKVTWRAIDGRETGEVRFEKLDADHTRVTYQLDYDPHGLGGQARHRAPLDEPPRQRGPRGLQGDGRGARLRRESPRLVGEQTNPKVPGHEPFRPRGRRSRPADRRGLDRARAVAA